MPYTREGFIIDDTMYGIPFEEHGDFICSLTREEFEEYLAANIETQEQFEEFRRKIGK